MMNSSEYLEKNGIIIAQNVVAEFGKIFEKYKFQEIAIIGENADELASKLHKDYRVTTVNIPKQLSYSLCGLNLARIQLKENTRLLVAYGDQHCLNLTKLISNKLDLPFCYLPTDLVNIYAKSQFAILDNKPIKLESKVKAIIIDENKKINLADSYAQIVGQIFGCFEVYLKEKFFEEKSNLNTKMLFDIYYEILNIKNTKSTLNLNFMRDLNLLAVIQYGQTDNIPFHDNYYLTIRFLNKNVHLFNEFDKISFVYSQMLSVLYDLYFNNNLHSPLFMMADDLEKKSTLSEYSKALSIVPARDYKKVKYIFSVYTNVLSSMTLSFQNLYQKMSFKLKNIMDDSGYELYNKLDCETMITIMKETSLFNTNSLLSKFGITEVYWYLNFTFYFLMKSVLNLLIYLFTYLLI